MELLPVQGMKWIVDGDGSVTGILIHTRRQEKGGIHTWDLLTNTQGTTVTLSSGGLASVSAVARDATHIYALLTDGAHWWGGDGSNSYTDSCNPMFSGTCFTQARSVELVKLDDNLTEIDRLVLVTADTMGAGGRDVVVRDGRAYVTVKSASGSGLLFVVDLSNFSLVDTDPNAAGDQPFTLNNNDPRHLAAGMGGGTVFVSYHAPANIEAVDTTSFTSESIIVGNQGSSAALRARNGKLYFARKTQGGGASAPTVLLSVFEGVNMTETELDPGFSNTSGTDGATGLWFMPGGQLYMVSSTDNEVAVYDVATDMRVDTDGNLTNGITNFNSYCDIGRCGIKRVTPY